MFYSQFDTFKNYLQALAQAYRLWSTINHPEEKVPSNNKLMTRLLRQDTPGYHRKICERLIDRIRPTEQQYPKVTYITGLSFEVVPTIVHNENYSNANWYRIVAKDVDGVAHDFQITITFDNVVGYCYLRHEEENPKFLKFFH